MKTITTLAMAMAAAALAGCAATGNDAGSTSAQASMAGNGAMAYCQRDKLVVDGGTLTCNWAATAREACEGKALTSIASSSVASGPDKSTMCTDGSPLVRVARK